MKRTLFLLLLACPLLLSAQRLAERSDPARDFAKFTQFYRYLVNLYVDEVESGELVDKAIVSVLAELDPHSSYIDADEMEEVNNAFDGSFGGIGVEFNVIDDTLRVVNTIAGGPAAQVGLRPNDRIVEVDGEGIVGIERARVPKLLRGEKGTRVEVGVVRRGEQQLLRFLIVRDDIPMNTVDAAYKIDSTTGYIKINRFGRTTMQEFREAFATMPGVEALVVDLRGNGGGLMDQAIDLANFFLPQGKLITSTEGRSIPPQSYYAQRDGEFIDGRVVVLLDENSASGSELMAGALQDWDRAVLIGRPTFGKGLVQRQFPLNDGSAVRITVARYHTPTGRVIQRPFEKGDAKGYYRRYAERLSGRPQADSLAARPQYSTLLEGRTVYGGGGINPDIEVALDTTGYTPYLMALVRRGAINEYVADYLDANRERIVARYPDFDAYRAHFEVSEQMLAQLAALAEKRGVAPAPEQLAVSQELLKLNLKALIAQKIWDNAAFYRIMDQSDETLKRAMAYLRTGK